MVRYLVRRLILSLVMLTVISAVLFSVLRVLPGDPVIARLGGAKFISQAAIDQLRHSMGLDVPQLLQYFKWISGFFTGNFGDSYANGYPVAQLIQQRLFPTFELAVAGLLFAVLFAVGFSLLAIATKRRSVKLFVDGYTVFGLSAPPFVIGILLIVVFASLLSLLPVGGYVAPSQDLLGNLRSLVLPALTLGVAVSAPLIRYLLGSMSEVERSLFVRTAIGKGLKRPRIVGRHIFPNGLLPALTSLGVSVGVLLGGVVEVEFVYSWPGLGTQVLDAVFARDYSLIQTTVLFAAAMVILSNLIVDILYGVLDPRLRIRGARSVRQPEKA